MTIVDKSDSNDIEIFYKIIVYGIHREGKLKKGRL